MIHHYHDKCSGGWSKTGSGRAQYVWCTFTAKGRGRGGEGQQKELIQLLTEMRIQTGCVETSGLNFLMLKNIPQLCHIGLQRQEDYINI